MLRELASTGRQAAGGAALPPGREAVWRPFSANRSSRFIAFSRSKEVLRGGLQSVETSASTVLDRARGVQVLDAEIRLRDRTPDQIQMLGCGVAVHDRTGASRVVR